MIRENILKIIGLHYDKAPETLAAMITGYLCDSEVVDTGWIEDDPRYWDVAANTYVAGVQNPTITMLTEDYRSIGIKLIKVGDTDY